MTSGMAKLKTRDLEWYFFSVLDKKYGNGSRTNRATERGYWKTTGKDRPVYHRSLVVGMKKTLVYHSGRAPKGQRSNWVMHEYRLIDEELQKAGILQVGKSYVRIVFCCLHIYPLATSSFLTAPVAPKQRIKKTYMFKEKNS